MTPNLLLYYSEILLILSLITIFSINKISNNIPRYSSYALIGLPIIFFFYIIFSYTDNVPFKDDYSLLESIYNMEFATSFSEWNKAFFKQVNQHRFGFERSIMWLIYKLLGTENIKVQIIIGNSFLLGILYLLLKIFKNFNLSIIYFTPLPLLIFNLTYFENATWGIAAIQNTPIIFFAFLTVHFLSLNHKNSFYLAILFATITLFTSGNGLAIWFVGILLLGIQNRWKKLGLWVFVMICLFTFYFLYDYEIIPSEKANLLKHPFLNLQYILAFWGNVFYQNISHPDLGHRYLDIILCILNGLFLTAIMGLLIWEIAKNRFQNLSYITLTLIGGMAFLACTGLMLVLSRPLEIKIIYGGEILSRRYMLFGAVFLCLGYLGFLFLTQKTKLLQKFGLICFIIISFSLNISSNYTSLSDVYKQYQELKLDGYYWKNHQMLLSFGEKYGEKIGYNHPTYMINLINKLESSGIYQLSQSEILPLIKLIRNSNAINSKIFDGKIDTTIAVGNTIAREKKVRISFNGLKYSKKQSLSFIVLKSQKNIFIIPAISKTNSLKDCISTQSFNGSKFYYDTWKAKFPSDIYEIWVIEEDGQNNFIPLFCNKTIQL
jgi:hypothetical protein